METCKIERQIFLKMWPHEEKFKIHLQESIDTFRVRFEEIFGHPIPFDKIKIVNGFLRGYTIQSIESEEHEGPDEGSEGLEIEFSDYRDINNDSDVPEWPFRHTETIYRYSNKERMFEYNIHGSIIIEVKWNADNESELVQLNAVDTTHVPRTYEENKI